MGIQPYPSRQGAEATKMVIRAKSFAMLKPRLPIAIARLLAPSRNYAAAQINAARALGDIWPARGGRLPR